MQLVPSCIQLTKIQSKDMCKVVVIYRDKTGRIAVDLDDNTVDFVDGIAYFDSDGTTYKIPIENLERIVTV